MSEMSLDEYVWEAERMESWADEIEALASHSHSVDANYKAKDGEAEAAKKKITHIENEVEDLRHKLSSLERADDGSDKMKSYVVKIRMRLAEARMALAHERRDYNRKFSTEAVLAQMNQTLKDMLDPYA